MIVIVNIYGKINNIANAEYRKKEAIIVFSLRVLI